MAQAIVSTRTGDSLVVVEGSEPDKPTESGVIYTGPDQPSLAEIFEQMGVITAVLERPVPAMPTAPALAATDVAAERSRRRSEAILLGALCGAIPAAGWVLLVADTMVSALRVNSHISLALALGGLVLVATVVVSAHSAPE